MQKLIYQSVTLSILMFLVFGGLYPLVTTLIGKTFFPFQAQGSLLTSKNSVIGSSLIGQNFSTARYFHGRPSAAGKGYDAANSSATNLAPTNKALFDKMETSIKQLLKENPTLKRDAIPIDLVTSSGSGLDPHISVEAAYVQIPRIAKSRKIKEQAIKSLVEKNIQNPTFGFIGEKTINVLELNIALDSLSPQS